MNSDEAERLVREMVEVGDESVYKPAIKALLEFHEMNKAIIGDRDREVKDQEEQLSAVAAEVERLRAENAELRKAGKGLCSNCGFACSIVDETEELKARLAWFEEALPHLLTAIEDYDDIEAVDAAKEWLEQHPKPEGT